MKKKKKEHFVLLKEKETAESQLREIVCFNENEKNKSLLQLSIIEEEVVKARETLEELKKKQSKREAKAIVDIEKRLCASEKTMKERGLEK